jgi:hypothetical protein
MKSCEMLPNFIEHYPISDFTTTLRLGMKQGLCDQIRIQIQGDFKETI